MRKGLERSLERRLQQAVDLVLDHPGETAFKRQARQDGGSLQTTDNRS